MVLPETGWSVIIGHKKQEVSNSETLAVPQPNCLGSIAKSSQDPLRVVVPLPLHTTALRPSVLKSIFDSLATLDTSTLPGADEPLIPSVEAVQKEMRSRRKEEEEDTDSPFDMVSPTEAEGAESGKIADGRKELVGQEIDREIIYLAIVTSDSTVVYYKLSKGIKKPADIPDE